MLLRDTHLEVNLDILAQNVQVIKNHIGHNVAMCAVIKANGYGMGAADIAPTLLENGADYLSVANLLEAYSLRKANPDWPILVMGHTPDEYLDFAMEHNITLTIFTLQQALLLNESRGTVAHSNSPYSVHLKIDTGFNRIGFKTDQESLETIRAIFELENIRVEGVYSHLALASYEDDQKQLERFLMIKEYIESHHPNQVKWYHICDSISAIAYPAFRLDMVRVGAALYGMKSYRYPDFPIEPVFKLRTRIAHLKTIEAGEGVSYDYAWRAEKKSVIATLPFGYADGYPRSLTGKGTVLIDGVHCPIIGIICMDQCMADVTAVENVYVGQDVLIYHDDLGDTAQQSGTNKNEILSRLMQRVPRVYVKNGKIDHIRNDLL